MYHHKLTQLLRDTRDRQSRFQIQHFNDPPLGPKVYICLFQTLANAKQPNIGKLVDKAMLAIERDNPTLASHTCSRLAWCLVDALSLRQARNLDAIVQRSYPPASMSSSITSSPSWRIASSRSCDTHCSPLSRIWMTGSSCPLSSYSACLAFRP